MDVDPPHPHLFKLRAEAPALEDFARDLKRRFVKTTLLCVAIIAGILWLDYRLIILCLFPILPIAVALGDWLRARKSAREGFIELASRPEGLRLTTASGETPLAPANLAARLTPRFVALHWRAPPRGPLRVWTIPGELGPLTAVRQALAGLGVQVAVEAGFWRTILGVFGVLGGAMAIHILGFVAAALLMGSMAEIGLYLVKGSGSWKLGLLLFGGATVLIAISAVIQLLLPRRAR